MTIVITNEEYNETFKEAFNLFKDFVATEKEEEILFDEFQMIFSNILANLNIEHEEVMFDILTEQYT